MKMETMVVGFGAAFSWHRGAAWQSWCWRCPGRLLPVFSCAWRGGRGVRGGHKGTRGDVLGVVVCYNSYWRNRNRDMNDDDHTAFDHNALNQPYKQPVSLVQLLLGSLALDPRAWGCAAVCCRPRLLLQIVIEARRGEDLFPPNTNTTHDSLHAPPTHQQPRIKKGHGPGQGGERGSGTAVETRAACLLFVFTLPSLDGASSTPSPASPAKPKAPAHGLGPLIHALSHMGSYARAGKGAARLPCALIIHPSNFRGHCHACHPRRAPRDYHLTPQLYSPSLP